MQTESEVTTRLLAETLEVDESEVIAAETFRQQPLSLTAPRGGDDERSLSDVLANDDVGVESQVGRAELMGAVDAKMKAFYLQLTDEREKVIWQERLIAEEPAALADLGQQFGISRERIRQIESRLKDKLRDFLTHELGPDFQLDFTSRD